MRWQVGTSGFSYKEWKGSFYPEDLPARRMLEHYAGQLPAVEINNTFYRLPKESVLAGWAEQVPDGFRFSIKASRRITHLKRLRDVDEPTAYLMSTLAALGDRLGVVLFQLPPFLQADLERLETFLALLPADVRIAFEFRHASWFDEPVYALLRAHDRALCIADTDDEDAPVVATASWGYVRLRRSGYDDAELRGWGERLAAQGWDEAFVFFKHEDDGAGPRMAARFLELVPGE